MKFKYTWIENSGLDIFENDKTFPKFVGNILSIKGDGKYFIFLSWYLMEYFGKNIIDDVKYTSNHISLNNAKNECIKIYNQLIKIYKMKAFI